MKHPKLYLIALFGVGAVWLLAPTDAQKKNNSSTPKSQASAPPTGDHSAGRWFTVLDHSPTDQSTLVGKVRLHTNEPGSKTSANDLWFRNPNGTERFITNEVVTARFSPDGKKIVYCTVSSELFIETSTGNRLAQISRAKEPRWRWDSAAVKFSAVPSLEYPDLVQSAVYDLDSGQVTLIGSREQK